jgi:Na+/H+-dicarboxylate symporter
LRRPARGGVAACDAGDGTDRRAAADCRVRDADWLHFNLDGSTLYLSLTSIFVAQAAGVHLTIGQQFVMLLTLIALEQRRRGRATRSGRVPARDDRTFKLPVEPVLVILGIDAVLDMLRTSVNVLGNCLANRGDSSLGR